MTFREYLLYLLRLVINPRSLKTMEWKMLRLLNKDRNAKGLSSLRMQDDLRGVARKHSKHMAEKDFFSHVNPGGASPADRLKYARVTDVVSGENLAKIGGFKYATVIAQRGLMKSPGHRKNILNKNYNCVGIGVIKSRSEIYYFTQHFAKRVLLFTKKIKKRVRKGAGLKLKGKAFAGHGYVLYQLRKEGSRKVIGEDVTELDGRGRFSFRIVPEERGNHKVSVFFGKTRNGSYDLVNEFNVRFVRLI